MKIASLLKMAKSNVLDGVFGMFQLASGGCVRVGSEGGTQSIANLIGRALWYPVNPS